jgi:hypothetical protein
MGGSQRVLLASIEQLLVQERHAALDERCQRHAAGVTARDAGV